MEQEEYIRKYFEGSLSAEEMLVFQKLIKDDSAFATAFEFEKNVKKAITLNKRTALKETLRSYEKPKKSHKWLYAAASVAILVGAFTWNSFHTINYSALYSEYYQAYPNTIAPTVRGEGTTDLKSEAFLAYDTGEYETALELFTKIYTVNDEDYALFYKGISLMELQRYEEALSIFNNKVFSENKTFLPFCKWYSALANLKLKNKEEAITILKDLAKTVNPQKEAAVKLLADLE